MKREADLWLCLLCKLKAGELFIAEVGNEFRNTDEDLIYSICL